MEFLVKEGSGGSVFILCDEENYLDWLLGEKVFIKNPEVLNNIFRELKITKIISENSFLEINFLKEIPCSSEFILSLFKENTPNLYRYIKENEITLYEIWNIYNSLESEMSPFREEEYFLNMDIKCRNDFNTDLYDIVKEENNNFYRFFGELFSIYSILTMKPNYFDDEDLLLNIFRENIHGKNIYGLSWTSSY